MSSASFPSATYQQCDRYTLTELTRGKFSTLSVARLILYADLLGAGSTGQLKQIRANAAA
ncbi:MAG: hypothetical protein ABSD53_13240 [Terriglobales bacterium]